MIPPQVQERLADSTAATAVVSATASWMVAAQSWAHLITTCLAGVSAAMAIAWHVWRFATRNKRK